MLYFTLQRCAFVLVLGNQEAKEKKNNSRAGSYTWECKKTNKLGKSRKEGGEDQSHHEGCILCACALKVLLSFLCILDSFSATWSIYRLEQLYKLIRIKCPTIFLQKKHKIYK